MSERVLSNHYHKEASSSFVKYLIVLHYYCESRHITHSEKRFLPSFIAGQQIGCCFSVLSIIVSESNGQERGRKRIQLNN